MLKYHRAILIVLGLLGLAGAAYAQSMGIGSGTFDLPVYSSGGGQAAPQQVLGVTSGQCLGVTSGACLGVE